MPEKRKVRVKVGEQLREIWRQAIGHEASSAQKSSLDAGAASGEAERKTLALPAIGTASGFTGQRSD